MKNISTTALVTGALVISFSLIIGGNILSGKSVAVAPNSPTSGHIRSASITSAREGHVVQDNNIDPIDDTSVETQFAPDFTLKNLNDEIVQLSSYRGKKPVVLDFFATWCPNCQRDMPKLSNMYDKYKEDIEVIGINLRENKRKVEKFINKNDITFPIVMDPKGQVAGKYGVRYTNFHVLINKEGVLVRTIPGDISESEVISLL